MGCNPILDHYRRGLTCLVQKESKFDKQHSSDDGTGTHATVQSL